MRFCLLTCSSIFLTTLAATSKGTSSNKVPSPEGSAPLTCPQWKVLAYACFTAHVGKTAENFEHAINPYAMVCPLARSVINCDMRLIKNMKFGLVQDTETCKSSDYTWWWALGEFWSYVCGEGHAAFMESFDCVRGYLQDATDRAINCVEGMGFEGTSSASRRPHRANETLGFCGMVGVSVGCIERELPRRCGDSVALIFQEMRSRIGSENIIASICAGLRHLDMIRSLNMDQSVIEQL